MYIIFVNHQVAKIATLNAYKILATALEAWIEDNEGEEDDDNRSQGDYEQDNEEYFTARNAEFLELLIDLKGGKVRKVKQIKVGKFAILTSVEDHEILQIDIRRSLTFIDETLKMSKNEYTEKLHQIIAWVKVNGADIAEKSFINNMTNTSVMRKGKKKEKELADYLHISYEHEKSVIDFGSAINFKPDKSFDKSFDKIWADTNNKQNMKSPEDKANRNEKILDVSPIEKLLDDGEMEIIKNNNTNFGEDVPTDAKLDDMMGDTAQEFDSQEEISKQNGVQESLDENKFKGTFICFKNNS